jgi:hypothetical protein
VRHHGEWVEVAQHRERAERRLRGRAERGQERAAADAPVEPAHAVGDERGGGDAADREPGDDAVPELDRRVVGGGRDDLPVLAQRPARAAEPGRGQSHDASRDDHEPQRRHRHERHHEERARCGVAPREGAQCRRLAHRTGCSSGAYRRSHSSASGLK